MSGSGRPESVSYALWLAVVSLAIGFVHGLRMAPTLPHNVSPGILFAASLVSVGFWGVIIHAFAAGRRWGRVVFVVLTLLAIPGLAVTLPLAAGDRLTRAIILTQQGANLAAAVLLLGPSSSRWYRQLRAGGLLETR